MILNYRKKGIASELISIAEKEAKQIGNTIGLGVGLYGGIDDGYGAAQKLYIKLGYKPDGLGITYNEKRVSYGQQVVLDDNLILWFTKYLV